jgi:hypothetical protein
VSHSRSRLPQSSTRHDPWLWFIGTEFPVLLRGSVVFVGPGTALEATRPAEVSTMDVFESPLVDGWDAWFGAWIDGFVPFAALPLVLVLILVALAGAVDARMVRRRFWCRLRSARWRRSSKRAGSFLACAR